MTLPADFDAATYGRLNPDLEPFYNVNPDSQAEYGSLNAFFSAHYQNAGRREGRRYSEGPVTSPGTLPADFDAAAYMAYWTDVRNNGGFTAESHYLAYGWREGRWPLPGAPATPPVVAPGSWNPPTEKGLHTLIDKPGDEIFALARIPAGFVFGEYSVTRNPWIRRFDGSIHNEIQISDNESVYTMRSVKSDVLASCEWNGEVWKRSLSGQWAQKARTDYHQDLGLAFGETTDGRIWQLINGYDNNTSVLKFTRDEGENWEKYKTFPGMILGGMAVDGNDIVLAGGDGGAQLLVNGITGGIIERYANVEGYSNWAVTKQGSLILSGTWNSTDKADGSYINSLQNGQGASLMPPLWYADGREYDKPLGTFVQIGGVFDGVPYFVITHGWEDTAGETLLVKYVGNKRLVIVTQVPCPHIMGMVYDAGDGGVYLLGGLLGKRGVVFFYKF